MPVVPPIASTDLFRAQIYGRDTIADVAWANSVQFKISTGDPTLVPMSHLMLCCIRNYNIHLSAARGILVKITGGSLNRFDNVGNLVDVGTMSVEPIPGEDATPYLPMQNSIVLSVKSPGPSRHTRGRIYLPGVPIAFVVDGGVTGAAQTDLTNAGVGFFQNEHAEYAPGLDLAGGTKIRCARISRDSAGLAVDWGYISEVKVNPFVRAQRRRQNDRGI